MRKEDNAGDSDCYKITHSRDSQKPFRASDHRFLRYFRLVKAVQLNPFKVTHLSNDACLVIGRVGVPSPQDNRPLPLDTQSF